MPVRVIGIRLKLQFCPSPLLLLELLSLLHVFHALEHVVGQLELVVLGNAPALSYVQVVHIHEPNLPKLVLIELDFHLKQVDLVPPLQVLADRVAHLQTVLQWLRHLQLIVVFSVLFDVELDFAVEGDLALFIASFLRTPHVLRQVPHHVIRRELSHLRQFVALQTFRLQRFIIAIVACGAGTRTCFAAATVDVFETRCDELKGEEFAETLRCHRRHGDTHHLVPGRVFEFFCQRLGFHKYFVKIALFAALHLRLRVFFVPDE